MISKQKKLEIANICYANVSGKFAFYSNEKYRGKNFKWTNFPDMMVDEVEEWVYLNHIRSYKKNKQEILELAIKFTKEISKTLITRAGFI